VRYYSEAQSENISTINAMEIYEVCVEKEKLDDKIAAIRRLSKGPICCKCQYFFALPKRCDGKWYVICERCLQYHEDSASELAKLIKLGGKVHVTAKRKFFVSRLTSSVKPPK
jgi:hypothetical protein